MGCDIHTKVEMQTRSGTWVRAEDIVPSPYYDSAHDPPEYKLYREEWHSGRDYDLFELLAGVRGSEIRAMKLPAGLPDDVSSETLDEYKGWGADAHTPTWYLLEELEPYRADFHSSYVTGCLDRMKAIANEELESDYTKIRVIMWFDN